MLGILVLNYFQTYKLEHLYKEDASFVSVKTMITSAKFGAQVVTEHIEIPRKYLLEIRLSDSRWCVSRTNWRLFISHIELPWEQYR